MSPFCRLSDARQNCNAWVVRTVLIRRCSNEALLLRSLPIQCVRTHGPEYKGIEAERVVLPADDEQTLTGLIGKHRIPVLVRKR